MNAPPLPLIDDAAGRLQRLVALRWVAVAAELALATFAGQWLGARAALVPVLAVCAAQLGLNLAALAYGRGLAASDRQLLAQLLFDVAALTAIAYFAGGPTNPLVSLYLLWIAVGAVMLPAPLAALLAALCIACYSLVNFVHVQVHIHDHEQALQAHLVGMWLIFVFSAIAIAWSVARLTAAVRERDAQLAAAREAALRNERVVALGNLAAGAAHELGTPLATLAVLVGELRHATGLSPQARTDLELMQAQIAECKLIITGLAARAGTSRAEAVRILSPECWIEELLERWRVQRPMVHPRVRLEGARPGPTLAVDATLGQAFLVLLNNAADASPGAVELDARWDDEHLELLVQDRGGGIAAEVRELLGRELVTTRLGGHGMGLMLARASIERSGGALAFRARAGGGTCVQVRLPLAGLRAPGPHAAPSTASLPGSPAHA